MNRQKSTFRISFYVRRTRPNKHGEVPVCVRITVNGQRADTTIRKSILPDQWDAIRGQASPRTTLGRLRRQKAIKCFIRGSLTVYQPSQIMSLAFTMDVSSTVAR